MNTTNNIKASGQELIVNRVILIASGGLDSTTLMHRLLHEKKEIFALTFDYGQKHLKEIEFARKNCEKFSISHKLISLKELTQAGLFGNSSLTSDREIPEGHYEDENMMSTVVPNRNMIMLSMALAYAISIGAGEIYYGAHAGDHEIYPDCRPSFVEAMQQVARLCHYWPIEIQTPYLHVAKSDIVREGLELNVDYSMTWTCYKGGKYACGKCGSCIERLEAFKAIGIEDLLQYQD